MHQGHALLGRCRHHAAERFKLLRGARSEICWCPVGTGGTCVAPLLNCNGTELCVCPAAPRVRPVMNVGGSLQTCRQAPQHMASWAIGWVGCGLWVRRYVCSLAAIRTVNIMVYMVMLATACMHALGCPWPAHSQVGDVVLSSAWRARASTVDDRLPATTYLPFLLGRYYATGCAAARLHLGPDECVL